MWCITPDRSGSAQALQELVDRLLRSWLSGGRGARGTLVLTMDEYFWALASLHFFCGYISWVWKQEKFLVIPWWWLY
jgi:hypothetical protein